MPHRRRFSPAPCLFGAASALLLAATAIADESVPLANLRACAELANDAERLACYDRLAVRHSPTAASAAAKPAPEAMFGMRGALTRKSASTEDADRRALASITARVTSLRSAASGELVVELDNGQAWKQEDATELLLATGDAVTISRAAFTSFRLSTPQKRVARVTRVR